MVPLPRICYREDLRQHFRTPAIEYDMTHGTRLPERNLDVLRAIAVVSVLVDHLATAAGGHIAWLGRVGVLLFFVHTSLVLMGSLERTEGEPSWVGRFYVRRAFRIYPLAIVTILWVLLARWPYTVPRIIGDTMTYHAVSPKTIIGNLLLVQNVAGVHVVFAVLWTLPIELQMYAVLPRLFLLARRGVRPVVQALVGGVVLAVARLAFRGRISELWRLTTLEFVPWFTSGVLAYALLRKAKAPPIGARWLPLRLVPPSWSYGFPPRYHGASWALCLAVGLMIPVVRELGTNWLTRSAAIVAKYSYGIYLVHVPALRVTFAALPNAPAWVLLPVAVVVTAALSWLGFHLVERPGIELGKWLTQRQFVLRPVPAVEA